MEQELLTLSDTLLKEFTPVIMGFVLLNLNFSV
jgi:hypothetical protein